MPDTLEQRARQQIDAMLTASGWTVQTRDKVNLSTSGGVAICKLTFKTGEPQYTLFVDSKAIGTVEAKPQGENLTGVDRRRECGLRHLPHQRGYHPGGPKVEAGFFVDKRDRQTRKAREP